MHSAQVQDWSIGPLYTTVAELPAPTDSQLRLRVLAAGVHNVVRSRASGAHYSARQLPHTPGIDCVGVDEATGTVYFALTMQGGTFSEYINIDKKAAVALPDGVDPAALAAGANPAMSSWMALAKRTTNLPAGFTVLILGATSASGELAVQSAKAFGAGKIIGAARNGAALSRVAGLDETIVLKSPVTETDFSKVEPDVILDYVYGDAAVHLLTTLQTKKAVQYVHIGTLSRQPEISISGALLRSTDLTIRGAGRGSWSMKDLAEELPTMVKAVSGWKLPEPNKVPLKDIDTAWKDEKLAEKGRLVFIP